MSKIFNISAAVARVAAACAAEVDIRYYLRGVLVEPRAEGGAYVIGTDGHMLCMAVDESATATRTVIAKVPKDVFKHLPRMRKRHDFTAKTGQRLVLSETGLQNIQSMTFEADGKSESRLGEFLIAGKHVDWRKTLPSPNGELTGVEHHIDLQLLHQISRGFDLDCQFAHRIHQIKRKEDQYHTGVYVLHVTDMPNVMHIVMPMSDSQRDHQLSLERAIEVSGAAKASKPWAPAEPEFLTEDPDHAEEAMKA